MHVVCSVCRTSVHKTDFVFRIIYIKLHFSIIIQFITFLPFLTIIFLINGIYRKVLLPQPDSQKKCITNSMTHICSLIKQNICVLRNKINLKF